MPETAREPFHFMTKPIGPICNIGCKYCFYLEKEALFEKGEKWRMSDEVLEAYIKGYIEAQPVDQVSFAWQGGEPTLLGIDFFRKAMALQKKYANGKRIENSLQTNGTLLNDEWCTFLREHDFLVGLSIDGPRELHDTWRVTKTGKGTYSEVMRGLEALKRNKVEFNTLTVVSRTNSQKPLEVYKFLRNIGSSYLQFIPLVERKADVVAQKLGLDLAAPPSLDEADAIAPLAEGESPVTEWSVRPEDYGNFLCKIFDRWVTRDVGRTFVQQFDMALGKWVGAPGGICYFAETCGRAMAIEHDGNVYTCDHFVYPHFKVGNVLEDDAAAIADSAQMEKFGNDKRDKLPRYCKECDYLFACNGECPKHRFTRTPDGEPGLNYLCKAYKQFFRHVDPAMRIMADLYRNKQPPAAIMEIAKKHPERLRAK